ncbi:MAG: class I SAM-dependent methyltransferase [Oscillospiraceae bacterium]|nr:class I SAM-dependent methyltransferase [Oscillospiraceae bacterium]
MSATKTGWERHNRVVFDEITENYDKTRWDYPPEIFSDIIKYSSPDSGKKALEIGAGTGKATVQALDAGYDVLAVEMGENMTEFLKRKFSENEKFKVITSTFEDVKLEDSSYDLIFAASAFHWIDANIGCPKVFRLLKDGGTFALLRNNVVRQGEGELTDDIEKAYIQHYYTHYENWRRREKTIAEMSIDDYLDPDELHRGFRLRGLELYGFTDIRTKLYKSYKLYTADEYVSLMNTMSDHIKLPEENCNALYKALSEAINQNGGILKADYVYQLYMGRKT